MSAFIIYCLCLSWLRSAPVVCFGSSSVFQYLFGYLGRCSCSFTSIDTLSACQCLALWFPSLFIVGEAVLTSILLSLIVKNVYYGVWPLSWTLTRQALQSLRAPADMPDQCTVHAEIHSSDRLYLTGCAQCRRGCRGGQLRAPCQTDPQTTLSLRFLTLLLTGGTP